MNTTSSEFALAPARVIWATWAAAAPHIHSTIASRIGIQPTCARRSQITYEIWNDPSFKNSARRSQPPPFRNAFAKETASSSETIWYAIASEARANLVQLPTDLRTPAYMLFLNMVARLQLRDRNNSVRVSCRQFGQRVGVCFDTIATYCQVAEEEEYIQLVNPSSFDKEQPGARRAAEYSFELQKWP
jgi:hypothetical protein